MNDPLAVYLHDHLAGSNFAIELAGTMRDQYRGEPLGNFAAGILTEIEQDREVLLGIIERAGGSHMDLKEAAAWLSEKAARFKLGHNPRGGLGTFEALETLSLGIQGKLSLWRALMVIAQEDERAGGIDYYQLCRRAEAQQSRVEAQRLEVARSAFHPVAQ